MFLLLVTYALIRQAAKLTRCLSNWRKRDEDVWGSEGISCPSLALVLDGGEWSASRPCRFTPPDILPDTHCIADCVSSKAESKGCGEEIYFFSCRGIEHRLLGRPARTDWTTPTRILNHWDRNMQLEWTDSSCNASVCIRKVTGSNPARDTHYLVWFSVVFPGPSRPVPG
jgi:hypothetical protein